MRTGRPMPPDPTLSQLARETGIQTSFLDMKGRRQRAAPETLREILRLWGVDASNARAAREALAATREQRWRQALPPVVVCWDGRAKAVSLRLPTDALDARASCKLHFEGGGCKSLDWDPRRFRPTAAARIHTRAYVALELPLPRLPLGYHQLEIELRGRRHQALLISAPTRSYSPHPEMRGWGSFLPLYALRSNSSWGAGNLGDAARLADWTASLGGRVLGTLPLLSGFLDPPFCEASPYSPASRLFWNEFHLDIEALPEFAACKAARRLAGVAAFAAQLKSFRTAALIDYPEQFAARRRVLQLLADSFLKNDSTRRREFQEFVRGRRAVVDYAEFRATCEWSGTSWRHWEERMRHGKLQPGDYSEQGKNYHLYVQWAAEEQVTALARRCREQGVHFYLDMPAGVHPDSYDVWRQQDLFAVGASVGAPPDMFFTLGQNWAFPPLHPEWLRRRGYSYFIDFVRFQMRHTGLLRLDHILGLHRLYWIPPGAPATMGAYVSYPAEEYHAILSLESHRHRTMVVGENLGTVPPEVNEAMGRHHFRETYVAQYEQRPKPVAALRRPPARSVTSLNTHDMPPFAAHWRGLDIELRARLKILSAGQVTREKKLRRAANAAVAQFLARKGLLKAGEADARMALRACLEWLARSPAEIVLVNLEDLWEETEWQNVPGTTTECPNWCRKARLSLEEIEQSPDLVEFLRHLTALRSRRR